MKTVRRVVLLIGFAALVLAADLFFYNFVTARYINHTSKAMQAKSIELDKYLPFTENSGIVRAETGVTLTGDLPVVDGAAALYPVYSAFVNALYPEESVEFDGENFTENSAMRYTNTRGAYKAVADGTADLVFCVSPSKEQLAYAKEQGAELEFVPIGKEAFVFLVHKNNPVDSLTCDEVRDIYAGRITRWSQVGGSGGYIDALQRNEGSGSQSAMRNFMGDIPMKRTLIGYTGRPIGFSFRYYVEGIVENGDIKMLALDGVYPNRENIASGAYPLSNELYAVYRKDNQNPNVKKMVDWILSPEGQKIVEESGYVPIR